MAVVTIPDENRVLTDFEEMKSFVKKHGISYDRWELERTPDASSSSDEILAAYASEIEVLKKSGGYVTADVINVNAATPGIDAMLEKFSSEHTHSEDEVRFVVHGRGVFHIHPEGGPVFAIQMGSGDFINVPAGAKHWFKLCEEKTIITIRLFQETTGWTPSYLKSDLHLKYRPACFSPATPDLAASVASRDALV